jgi:2-hydroxychromene-2-carboxylate isomerase
MKRAYVNDDVVHTAIFHQADIGFPDPWPLNSIKALNVSLYLKEETVFAQFAMEVFKAAWAKSLDISKDDVLEGCFVAAGGTLDKVREALIHAPTPGGGLQTATQDALNKDIFGVPMMVHDDRNLFGSDRIAMLESWLQ